MSSPATAQLLRGNGPRAYNGWPDLPKLEALRDAWLAAEDQAEPAGDRPADPGAGADRRAVSAAGVIFPADGLPGGSDRTCARV